MIRIAAPEIGAREEAAVRRVLRSGRLAQGPEVEAFERELAERVGARDAVAVTNGTTALELALLALGIGPGDEVVTSPLTFFASVSSILRCGATPVLADIDPETYNVDPDAVAAAITPRTAAIMPVHLYGRPCDMAALRRVARRAGTAIVEDACQAIGARFGGTSAGAFGVGCYSFYGSKNITAGEGGAVVVQEARVARRLRSLRSQGSQRQYRHQEVSSNYRMTDLQGAILRAQLRKLDAITRRRQRNARAYDRLIDGSHVVTPPSNEGPYESNYHQYTLRVRGGRRDALAEDLHDAGIEARVYYPRAVHQQPAWPHAPGAFPHAERACREVLSIPVHAAMKVDDVRAVADRVNAFGRAGER
ncbi:MAG: DegT/DnrJ/EryC1/StrS family aminotransferase [Actinomycetota bacterium]